MEKIKRNKEKLVKDKDGGVPGKKSRKLIKGKKKEINKQVVGSGFVGESWATIWHQYKLLRKRRAKNKIGRKSRQINRRIAKK